MTDAGYRTLADMTSEVGRLVHDTSTGRKTAIKEALNRAYEGACNLVEWPEFQMVDPTGLRILSDTTLKTMEASEPEFPLPIGSGRLFSLHYQDAAETPIEVVPASTLFSKAASQLNSTGRPRFVCPIGTTAQVRRLAASGSVSLFAPDSSSNNNVHSPAVEFRKSTTTIGHEASTVVVSGSFSSGVSVASSAYLGYPISKVTIPSGWVGALEIRDGSANVLVHVPPDYEPAATATNDTSRIVSAPLFRAWPVPDQDYPLTVTWLRQPRRLVEDEDSPEIPVAMYLVEKASAEMLRHENKDALSRSHEQEAASFLRGRTNRDRPGAFVVPLRRGNFTSATDIRNA